MGNTSNGDTAEMTLRVAQEHDRIAEGLNDVVMRRLFSAGLSLEMALGLMGEHPAARKVREAIGELDLAIRDVRNVVFDHCPLDWTGSGARPTGAPDGWRQDSTTVSGQSAWARPSTRSVRPS
jgi:hypothetical protein